MIEKIFGISTALAEQAAGAAAGTASGTAAAGEEMAMNPVASMITMLLPMVLIFLVFYLFLIRPQRKKDKKVKEMLNNLKAGDRICTIGGIYGTIVGLKDDTVTLSVGRDNLSMVVARWAIRSVEEIAIENDAAKNRGVRRERYLNAVLTESPMKCADAMIDNGDVKSYAVYLRCKGCLLGTEGNRAVISDPVLGDRDDLYISAVHYRMKGDGAYSNITLKRRTF